MFLFSHEKVYRAENSKAWILLTIFAWIWEFLTLPLELSQAQDSEQSSRSLFSDRAPLKAGDMEVSQNGGSPKWMVYKGKSC